MTSCYNRHKVPTLRGAGRIYCPGISGTEQTQKAQCPARATETGFFGLGRERVDAGSRVGTRWARQGEAEARRGAWPPGDRQAAVGLVAVRLGHAPLRAWPI